MITVVKPYLVLIFSLDWWISTKEGDKPESKDLSSIKQFKNWVMSREYGDFEQSKTEDMSHFSNLFCMVETEIRHNFVAFHLIDL